MTRYINPYTDFGFKKLFGEEGSKDILIDFLNSLLPERHQIAELSFTNTEKLPNHTDERTSIFDISCKAISGEYFIIEMQKVKMDYFKDRSLYYVSIPIKEQAIKGKWHFELQPVYFIGILDFVFDPHSDCIQYIELKNKDNQVFYDKLGMIYLQLPAFKKTVEQLETKIDKWMYFLQNLDSLESIPQILNEPVFHHAFEIAEFSHMSIEQQKVYEKAILNYTTVQAVQEALKREGLEEGLEKGREEGMEIGRGEEKKQIAKNLKLQGLSVDIIINSTGLSEQEINNL